MFYRYFFYLQLELMLTDTFFFTSFNDPNVGDVYQLKEFAVHACTAPLLKLSLHCPLLSF